MTTLPEFKAFDKIPRLRRTVVVTEKIDGTNALVWISDDLSIVAAGSRSRWITPTDDNAGFARWVEEHADELRGLGPGHHYGEWWGAGIQRRYGLDHKRFSLFNAGRWTAETPAPACCHVVPVLAEGLQEDAVEKALAMLREGGSIAAPGFLRPEGIVVYHTAARSLFKVLLEGDEIPKGVAA
jgi:hypothetical protein